MATADWGRFGRYARRIKRIFPALVLVLAFCLVFGWFALYDQEYKTLGKHVAGGAGFVANILLWQESGYFDSDATSKNYCTSGHSASKSSSI